MFLPSPVHRPAELLGFEFSSGPNRLYSLGTTECPFYRIYQYIQDEDVALCHHIKFSVGARAELLAGEISRGFTSAQ